MRLRSQKSSVVLVALSCVTVLGIAMVGFLAVSNQAMKLSNRVYAQAVSKQLAEMGLERALRSFNNNTFSSWTLPNATTATRTLTVSSSHYGNSGLTTAINIRVDHYLGTKKATPWSVLTTYAVNDFVSYQGVWYLCTAAPPGNQDPSNTSYWKSAPEPWNPYANYRVGNIALSGGTAYRCIAANINQSPPNANWTGFSAAAWNATTTYSVDDVAFAGGTPYRCILTHSNQAPPNTTYWLSAPVIYAEGVATLPDSSATTIKTQLRALIAPAALFPNALGAADAVTLSNTGTVDSYNSPLTGLWSAATTYTPGTVVRSGTTLYRCKATTTNNPPPNTTYWVTAPLGYSAVIAGGKTSGTAVSIISAVVGGYVAAPSASASPYDPQASFGVGSTVSLKNADGTVTSPHPTSPNVDRARISRSPYVPQFDIQTVTGAGVLPSPNGTTVLPDGPTTLGTAGATTPSIYNITGTYESGTMYFYSGLYLSDAADVLTINGPVILNVSGPLYTYSGRIVITPTGSLEIYFTGQLYVGSSSANSGIQNDTLDPRKCILVGTSSANTSSSHYYWATNPFYGVIYMPNAYVSTWNNVTIYGAIAARNIIFPNAGGVLHYDTALRTAGKVGTFIDAPYEITEWRELTDPTDRVVLP